MFIKEDDLLEIKVYCRKKKMQYEALTEKEYKLIKEEDKKKYELLALKMRNLTWGLYNTLQDEALVENDKGDQKFSYRIYKENKLKKLIKDWSAKDKDGKNVLVSENMIAHLAPSIAEAIIRAYDEESTLTDEEEGK
jgi:hypothetical protein